LLRQHCTTDRGVAIVRCTTKQRPKICDPHGQCNSSSNEIDEVMFQDSSASSSGPLAVFTGSCLFRLLSLCQTEETNGRKWIRVSRGSFGDDQTAHKCDFARGSWNSFSRMGKKIGGMHPDWGRVCFVRKIW
jgi:hypothetical protein